MPRVVLVHWKATEAEERAAVLRGAGYGVSVLVPGSGADLAGLRREPPDAIVIDLSRLPSQGRAVAFDLRRAKAGRTVPIVFAGGEPDKVARTRELLPDAVYAEWDGIAEALTRAFAHPPAVAAPIPAGAMPGYSGTPLVKKLGIRAGTTVVLLGAPGNFEAALAGLPEGVRLVRQARGAPTTILLFVRSKAELERRFPAAAGALAEGGRLWLVWPKQASGVRSDLTEIVVRAFGLAEGWVDYKICAVDETWSGLLFARRRR
ncbi:MAG TPA: hypothetical protein VN442_11560 [Bryobacteraceae bacterium]|nr:hypothetical protein [Bryobacteraceae bacterium]